MHCLIFLEEEEFKKLCNSNIVPAPPTWNIPFFIKHLEDYPNEQEKIEIIQHLNGYSFDVEGDLNTVKTVYRPLTKSAKEESLQCDQYFIDEMKARRITAVTDQVNSGQLEEPKIYIPFSVIDTTKKRTVFNFSASINDISLNSLVPDNKATVELITLQTVASKILEVGNNCYIGKEDLRSAFRQSKTRPEEALKYAYWWRDEILVDWFMPWGTRNAARKCHLVSKAIVHIVNKFLPIELNGRILCYIDDFMFFGNGEKECKYLMDKFEEICEIGKVDVKFEKREEPSQNQVVLGKEFFCPILWVQNNPKKLIKYKHKLNELIKVDIMTQSDLQSIEGSLTNIAPFAWPLKCLLRRFRSAIPYCDNKYTLVYISKKLKDEAKLWLQFIDNLNGISINELLPEFYPEFNFKVEGDAGNKGCGAFCEPYWLYTPFHEYEVKKDSQNNIAHREMFWVVAACNAWGGLWTHSTVLFTTDNAIVYYALVKKDTANEFLMEMVKRICLLAVKFKFRFYVQWVKRNFNQIADALSNLDVDLFKKLCDEYSREYTEFPMIFQRPYGKF